MNDSAVRTLAGVPSGIIGFNNLLGKSNSHTVSYDRSSLYGSALYVKGGHATAVTETITAIATGGSGSFTCVWTAVREQGNAVTQSGQTANPTNFRITGGGNTNYAWDGYVYATLTDTVSGLAVRGANVPCNMSIEVSGGGGPTEV